MAFRLVIISMNTLYVFSMIRRQLLMLCLAELVCLCNRTICCANLGVLFIELFVRRVRLVITIFTVTSNTLGMSMLIVFVNTLLKPRVNPGCQ
jgi:hypothetical protein